MCSSGRGEQDVRGNRPSGENSNENRSGLPHSDDGGRNRYADRNTNTGNVNAGNTHADQDKSAPQAEYCLQLEPIGVIRTDFKEKFGIPRQPGLVPGLEAIIEFCPKYRNPDVVRGIESFEYLWLIFGFSRNWKQTADGTYSAKWSSLVRPPRLGGQVKEGVFATRSPYRPSGLGLSSVRLLSVDTTDEENPRLVVGGADLLDGTPIYDIKPYVAYSDAHPDAVSGFAVETREFLLVNFPEDLLQRVQEAKRQPLIGVLAQDPRAAYEKKDGEVYGMRFADYDVRFMVTGETLTVVDVLDVTAGAENGSAERIKSKK